MVVVVNEATFDFNHSKTKQKIGAACLDVMKQRKDQ
jgi:hypothetical protein